MRRIACFILLAVSACPCAQAATFCVGNGAQLEAAIQGAINNGQADEIRLRQGIYQRTQGTQFIVNHFDAGELLMTGGWSGANGTCTTIDGNPGSTVIDAMTTGRGLRIKLNPTSGDVTVFNLSFINGRPDPNINFDQGTGLDISRFVGSVAGAVVERCIFQGNHADNGAGLALSVAGVGIVRNNLFIGNTSNADAAAASLFGTGGGVQFINNTVTGNQNSSSLVETGALEVYGDGPNLVANNIIVGNTRPNGAADVVLGAPALLVSNLVGSIAGTLDAASTDNFAADARFVGNGDYRLLADSPARDRGTMPPSGVGAIDLLGRPRIRGSAVDLGAFEFEAVFRNGFEGN